MIQQGVVKVYFNDVYAVSTHRISTTCSYNHKTGTKSNININQYERERVMP